MNSRKTSRNNGLRFQLAKDVGLSRLGVMTVFFLLGFLVLMARLFYWQVYKGKQLAIQARGQQTLGYSIDAKRGDILASDGTWLTASSPAWLVYAYLPDIEMETNKIADKLAPFFAEKDDEDNMDKAVVLEEASRLKSLLTKDGGVVWIPLKHRVEDDVKQAIEELGIKGIGFEPQEIRMYPEGSGAAHLLGFVGKDDEGDDQGYFGLEGHYDLPLSGKSGFLSRESDAQGVPILLENSREIRAIKGVNLLTHIDKAVQLTIDKKLADGLEKYGASGGTIIVMSPKTGSILGMSSLPSYDPSEYWDYGDKFFSNPAISSTFEPGSVFKVLVMAAALDAGVVEPDTKCEICGGPFKIDKYFIKTWDDQYHSDATMLEVIVHSDNVGMVFVGQRLGIEKMYSYLEKFGIGSLTGVDLQGESGAFLREKDDWSQVDLATASFGQGVVVTPIQIIRAVAALANGGVNVTPQVVAKIEGDDWQEEIISPVGERVVSEKAASEITAMMVEAAKNGEAKWTHSRGFKVAGKTGTAQIPIAGHYDEEKTIASFVGFAPYDNPKFIMLVSLREPTSSPWASETAAPLWYSVAKELFVYFGIQPES